MSTQATPAPRGDACPEPEQLAAYVDATLEPAERTEIERHLAGCPECLDVVAGSVETLKDLPAQTSRRTAWVAAAGAVIAVAAALAFIVRPHPPSPYYVPEMAQLVALDASTRTTEARLSGGFRYAPVTRGAGDEHGADVAATAERVRSAIAGRSGPDAEAARGVTLLLNGDAPAAVGALERATARPPAAPRMLSDLAAAYLQRDDPGDRERALAAAEQAIAGDGLLREARFNRALALDRLDRLPEALGAWREYLAQEPDPEWAAEAERQVVRLSESHR